MHASRIPTIFTLFGITGDLAALKIIPALWQLFRKEVPGDDFTVIGFARRDLDADGFRKIVADSVRTYAGVDADSPDFDTFFARFSYHRATFEDKEGYDTLRERISAIEAQRGLCANKLFYLAVPPSSYEGIFSNLGTAGLSLPCSDMSGWSRILIEKPFGTDLASARALQEALAAVFAEDQIYRVDHYNFKDAIQERAAQADHAWDDTTIRRIDVRLLETVGVEARGAFYDSVGALRDVGQNHMLSMLAMITGQDRALMLRTLRPWTAEAIGRDTARSQYAGYRDIKGVAPGSMTETHFSIQTGFEHPAWKGVLIHLEAGKRMPQVAKEIEITMKEGEPVIMRFDTADDAYAKMISAAIKGNHGPFISEAEVEASWIFIDPIIKAWEGGAVPLGTYQPS
jgi:glucose-6-phosphate 1-dehydrogenase